MAKSKDIKPTITVDGNTREMTDEELSAYQEVTLEVNEFLEMQKEKIRNKELATAKFLALGLTEEDLRMMGL